MGYREQQSIKKFLAEEREAQERPVREAEAKLKATHARLLAVQKDTLVNPEIRDMDLWIDPSVDGKSMPQDEAIKFNVQHLQEFCRLNPGFTVTDRNLDTLGDYLHRHGIALATSNMLTRLYVRMCGAGVEFDRPAPKPVPQQQAPALVPKVAPKPAAPILIDGWDLVSGEPRKWTPRELDKLSSLDYRRALHLFKDNLALPTVGPGSGKGL